MLRAICEAMSRPGMRFVSVKSVEQKDIQAAHRVRAELIKQRTAKANQIRGLVAECGLIAPKGDGTFAQGVTVLAGRCGERLECPVPSTTEWTVG
jgi:transposase